MREADAERAFKKVMGWLCRCPTKACLHAAPARRTAGKPAQLCRHDVRKRMFGKFARGMRLVAIARYSSGVTIGMRAFPSPPR